MPSPGRCSKHAPGRNCRAACLVTCHGLPLQIGGTIARAFAARRPERVATLIVVGSPTPLRAGAAEAAPALAADFEKRGVEPSARESMGGRLGSEFPPAGAGGGRSSDAQQSLRTWQARCCSVSAKVAVRTTSPASGL